MHLFHKDLFIVLTDVTFAPEPVRYDLRQRRLTEGGDVSCRAGKLSYRVIADL